jgi:DNA helicase-2/ATP-dependent DNA helicase PcrA
MYQIIRDSATHSDLFGKFKRIDPFTQLIEKYRTLADTEPIDILAGDLVADLNLIEELRAEDPVLGESRVENIEAFIEGAAEFARHHDQGKLVDYLAEISLYTDLDAYKEVEDKLTLMSLHSAKGLEFDNVFIVGLEEGLFPLQKAMTDPMELEEERRLFYVGATRARKRLFLSTATTRFRFGEVQSMPSRFIKEIPESLLDRRDWRVRQHYEYTTDQPGLFAAVAASSHNSVDKGERYYDYDDESPFKVGRIVSHPTFGRGKIIQKDGYGDSLRLEIMFTGLGIKKIMAKFAKLKVVG